MIRIFSGLLSLYFLAGSALLPRGDFGFTAQLPKLYAAFVQLNGTASYDEFLEEELLEPYSLPENNPGPEPGEKECRPVTIDFIFVNANSTVDIPSPVAMIETESSQIRSFPPFVESFPETAPDPFFHPPKTH